MSNFFSTLKETGIDRFGISISYDGDTVGVSVLPKSSAKDKALQSLKPLTLRGNVAEVDEKFFQILQKPLEQTHALFRNTVAFEQSLKETEQKTQHAKKKKESATKKASELKQLLKEKGFNPMQDHKKATDLANEVLKLDPNHKEAQKVVKDMKAYESPSTLSIMEIATIERKYIYQDGKNNSIELDDIDPNLTHEQVMEHYAQLYAELTNANIMDKGIVNGHHEIHFKTLAGTKG